MDSSDLRFLALDHCGDRLCTLEDRKIWAQRVTLHMLRLFTSQLSLISLRVPQDGWPG